MANTTLGYESAYTGEQIDAAVGAVLGNGTTTPPLAEQVADNTSDIEILEETTAGHTTDIGTISGKVTALEGIGADARLNTAEGNITSLQTLASSGYRIAGFIAPNNSYLAKAVEGTCYFVTNPASASWHDSVVGKVYLPPSTYTPSSSVPSSVTGWTSFTINGACIFGYKGGAWSKHDLPLALVTELEEVRGAIIVTIPVDSFTWSNGVFNGSVGNVASFGTNSNWKHSQRIHIPENSAKVHAKVFWRSSSDYPTSFVFVDNGNIVLSRVNGSGSTGSQVVIDLDVPSEATGVYLITNNGTQSDCQCSFTMASTDYVRTMEKKVADITTIRLVGDGAENAICRYTNFIAGHTYRLWVKFPELAKDEVTGYVSGANWFAIRPYTDDTAGAYLHREEMTSTKAKLDDYYDFVAPDCDYLFISTRANRGLEQVFVLEDITELENVRENVEYVNTDAEGLNDYKKFNAVINATTGAITYDSGTMTHVFRMKKGDRLYAKTLGTGSAQSERLIRAGFSRHVPYVGDILSNPFAGSAISGVAKSNYIDVTAEYDCYLALSQYISQCDFSFIHERGVKAAVESVESKEQMAEILAKVAKEGYTDIEPYEQLAGMTIVYDDTEYEGVELSKGEFYTFSGTHANNRIRLYRIPEGYNPNDVKLFAQVAKVYVESALSCLVAYYAYGANGELDCLGTEYPLDDNTFVKTDSNANAAIYEEIHAPQGTNVVAVVSRMERVSNVNLRFCARRHGMKILCIGDSWGRDTMRELWGIANDAGYGDIVVGQAYQGGCGLSMQYRALSEQDYFYYHKSFYQFVYGNYQFWRYGNNASASLWPSSYNNGRSGTAQTVTKDGQTYSVYGKNGNDWAGCTLEQIVGSEDWDIILIRCHYTDLLLPTTLTSEDDGTGYSIDILDFIEALGAYLTPRAAAKVKWGITNTWTFPQGSTEDIREREIKAICIKKSLTDEEWVNLPSDTKIAYRDELRADRDSLYENWHKVARYMNTKCSYMVDTQNAIALARESGRFNDVGYGLCRAKNNNHLADGLPKYICGAELCYELLGLTPTDFKGNYEPTTDASGGDGDEDEQDYPVTKSRCLAARKVAWEAYNKLR